MDNDLRNDLIAHFERDIGRPPIGARERVLRGLDGAVRRSRRARLRWAAEVTTVLLAMLTVTALLLANPGVSTGGPMPRIGAAVAYDARHSVLVLFGGWAGDRSLNDTWTWDGRDWTRQHPVVSPPGAYSEKMMAFDVARGVMVLYGTPGVTWTWNGSAWARHVSTTPPAAADSWAMAYDPLSRTVMLYVAAGWYTGTWAWDGTRWLQLRRGKATNYHVDAMVFDGSRLLLLGDRIPAATGTNMWAWTGNDWSPLSPAVRLPSGSASVAFDAARGRVVAYVEDHGQTPPETWEWDGVSWHRDYPLHQPTLSASWAVQYDTRKQRVILHASPSIGQPQGSIWTWDGSDWTHVN
jgi:hypothetical protein